MRAALIHLVIVAAFGMFLPWSKGVDFLDPVTLGAYACLGVVFSASAATRRLEPATEVAAFRRIAVSIAYGLLMSLLILAVALGTVYSSTTVVVGPDLASLGRCLVFGLALSAALSAAAVWTGVRFSETAARLGMRLVFLGLLAVFFWRSRWLPDVALMGAAISGIVGAGFLVLLRTSFSRMEHAK